MSNVTGAVAHLHAVLQRYMSPVGYPPDMPSWRYPVEDARREGTWTLHDAQFRGLVEAPISDEVAEAVKELAPFRELASAILDVKQQLSSAAPSASLSRVSFLFEKFLDLVWYAAHCRQVAHHALEGEGAETHEFGFSFRPLSDLDQGVVNGLVEAAHALLATPTTSLDSEEQEIVALLKQVGHRLTTSQMLAEFESRRNPKAESTIKAKLARMVKAKALSNRHDTRPHKGYGLPEWP